MCTTKDYRSAAKGGEEETNAYQNWILKNLERPIKKERLVRNHKVVELPGHVRRREGVFNRTIIPYGKKTGRR